VAAGPASADPTSSPLTVTPTEALDRLSRAGHVAPVSAREAALIKDANDGRFDDDSLTDVCCVVAGVTDPDRLRTCRERLDQLIADARKQITGTNSTEESAANLHRFLHAGPMAKGFNADQTDLHTLLDTGVFNCVSSATLYTIVGRRLGLDVRPVEVPEHMFVSLSADGRTIDLEPTDPRAFESDATRRPRPNDRRELSDPALAAVVAYNHGVARAKEKHFAEAVRYNLLALALDPDNKLAARNAVSDLVNWPVELMRSGKYTEAATVLAAGLELAPTEPALVRNTLAVYDAWADLSIRRQDWASAARVYETGLRQLPGDKHLLANLAYCQQQMGR
jgi:regulator of sirC expression with transglutaminase-like and TPR domain